MEILEKGLGCYFKREVELVYLPRSSGSLLIFCESDSVASVNFRRSWHGQVRSPRLQIWRKRLTA